MAKRISEAVLRDALRKAGGIPAGAAALLECARSTVTRRVNKSPALQEFIEELQEELLDLAETKLVKALRKEEPWAIRFTLETKGKKRGYTRTFEIEASKPVPIIFTAGQADVC